MMIARADIPKVFGLIFLITLTRIIPHPWNFTPVIAASLYLGFSLPLTTAIVSTLFSMALADMFLGVHFSMWYVYLSMALVTYVGSFIKNISAIKIVSSSFIASTLFFLTTNFAVWLTTPLYEKSFVF